MDDAQQSFDDLLEDIKAHPERLHDPSITSEQILEIQKRINPYAYVTGANDGGRRTAAISCTNLRADYQQRFAVTSLIGFLFRLLDEWEVPAEVRRWTTTAGSKRAKAEEAARRPPPTPDDLLRHAEDLCKLARLAKDAAAEATEAVGTVDSASAPQDVIQADRALAKARGLQYVAMAEFHRVGLEINKSLDTMEALVREHPQGAAVLDSAPAPARRPTTGQIEMPAKVAKGIISNFLRTWFEFNPDAHVRSAYDEFVIKKTTTPVAVEGLCGEALVDSADPDRLPLAVIRAPAPGIATAEDRDVIAALTVSHEAYNAAIYMLRNEQALMALLTAVENPEKYRRLLLPIAADSPVRPAVDVIPPQDTFHRWNYYTEVNYEALRTATDTIYHDKPDLDWALILYDTFEGTSEEINAAFEAFRDKHQEEVMSDIKGVDFGSWTLLGDFKENREKINIYNKHTDVLKRILDRHAEDKKLGQELMRNRVRQAKAKNIREAGPDPPGLAEYASQNKQLATMGAERVISREEMYRLERARGNIRAAKELEVIDQCRQAIKDLSEIAKVRTLAPEEDRRLKEAQADLIQAQEMLEVPDDAIQVDVWTHDTTQNTMKKSKFYTKAEAPEHIAQIQRDQMAMH